MEKTEYMKKKTLKKNSKGQKKKNSPTGSQSIICLSADTGRILKEILVYLIYVGDTFWDQNGGQNLNMIIVHLCLVTIHREVGIIKVHWIQA